MDTTCVQWKFSLDTLDDGHVSIVHHPTWLVETSTRHKSNPINICVLNHLWLVEKMEK